MTEIPTALLERERELAMLREQLAALHRGAAAGACLLLRGEPGTGKSSLLQAARREAAPGVLWLQGSCEPLLAPLPISPLIELLDVLPPSLSQAVRAGRQAPDVMAGMLSLLRDRKSPVVLAIDDAQWANGATLDLLRWLGRRIEATPPRRTRQPVAMHFTAEADRVPGLLHAWQQAMLFIAPLAGAMVLDRLGAPSLFAFATGSAQVSFALFFLWQGRTVRPVRVF
jgi:predicted ATPase